MDDNVKSLPLNEEAMRRCVLQLAEKYIENARPDPKREEKALWDSIVMNRISISGYTRPVIGTNPGGDFGVDVEPQSAIAFADAIIAARRKTFG